MANGYAKYSGFGGGSSGGVTSLNSLTGALNLVGAGGITITPSSPNITITGTGGTVTSVALTTPSWLTVSGSPITTSGTLAITGTSESANLFLASPNGSSGAMTPRSIVAADIPILNQNTTGTASNVTASSNSTLITLSVLSLPYSQVTGAPAALSFTAPLNLTGSTVSIPIATSGANGYLSSTDWNTFNSKQASGSYITALTGDVTASGPGSSAASLVATSNSTLTTLSALSLPYSQVTGGPGGTVTSVSVVSANGLAGSSSGGSTPALTLSTSITGILQGNGTAISAATTTGSGNVVLSTSPTLVTPALGTPSALVGTNITGTASSLTAGNINASSNSTLTTLSALSLPYSQVTGGPVLTVPKVTQLLSGSGTFTTSTSPSPLYIRVILAGGGGGGGGASSAGSTAGSAGGNTTFGTTFLSANGGSGGGAGIAGAIGGGGTGGTSVGNGNGSTIMGGGGGGGNLTGGAVPASGGMGGDNALGGGAYGSSAAGGNGASNTGGGGGGAAASTGVSQSAGGGGAGGYVNTLITTSISSTYAYAVGAGGVAGTGTIAGGTGGSGYIEVVEYFQ